MREDWQRASVEQWGYVCGSEKEIAALVWPVRFKPVTTLLLVFLGFRWPRLLIAVGVLGLIGTFFPKLSWIDQLYNRAVRRVFRSPSLGPDPSPRRWLCRMADAFVLASGLALSRGHEALGIALGCIVVLLAGNVVLTGICLPAYLVYCWRRNRR